MNKTNLIVMNLAVLSIVLSTALLQTSCLSPGSANSTRIEVSESGIIRLEGKPVSSSELADTLRSYGFKPMSTIKIHVPDDVSEMIIKTITVSLSKSGFRRVLFVKPRQATADVSKKK